MHSIMFIFIVLAKNVATDISEKLCDSVARKLEGKVLGTFTGSCQRVVIFFIYLEKNARPITDGIRTFSLVYT